MISGRARAHHTWSGASRRVARVAAAANILVTLAAACRPTDGNPPPLRMWTSDLAFQVSTDPVPPPARQDIRFKVVARDKASGQAIEGGEGRVFATNSDGINAWDALTPGPQPGTYYAKLTFITAGDWAMGMQFRRDSTRPIERMDWRQEVQAASGEARIR